MKEGMLMKEMLIVKVNQHKQQGSIQDGVQQNMGQLLTF
eukprot:CAMPEP_0114371434 /NCGR_PEP_ID=MMETSP0101-20121206/33327_1 /TAXON_ID=38822 ORGANISM="Pteridomonas danica, Strain PT" /NCGR_SAMPLE_ID=MMETSP0101 /ASSEMBLY_ACC=CAM_ASM_000211 /LENGTH=38 /DNA_ID= /DNA_START= /DNA_END= /DNA_ORIENTATION=